MKQQLVTILLGEVSRKVRGEIFRPTLVASAPAYTETAVPRQVTLGRESAMIEGREVVFNLRGYAPDVLLVEVRTDVENLFGRETFDLEEKLYREAHRILQDRGGSRLFSEEYSVFAVSGYEGPAEQFLQHSALIASLLKSERMPLDAREVEHSLQSQIKYAMNDLTIVDWDGAFVFDAAGDFEEEIELLTLANLQLLRHRILDRQLDERLARASELVHRSAAGKPFGRREIFGDLREIVQARMASINELQRMERDIKLIGDWYSARFFELATAKFRLDAWRATLRGKLDSLEDVYQIIVENFSLSAKGRAEWIQIVAFFILQVGWFLLIVLEFLYFTRK
jgi:hypothetical protein